MIITVDAAHAHVANGVHGTHYVRFEFGTYKYVR